MERDGRGRAGARCVRERVHARACLWLLVPLLLLCTKDRAWAQQTVTSSLAGVVEDPNKYAIPGAELTLLNAGTNVKYTKKTEADGHFRFSNLDVGTYSLEVKEKGFEGYVRSGITLSSDEQVTLPAIVMKLGSESIELTVRADTPALDTSSPNEVQTLSGVELEETPVRSNDVIELLSMLPGVADDNPDGHDAPARNTIGSFAFNGVRADSGQVSVNLNGVNNMTAGNPGYQTGLPSIAMVKEIKITASDYTSATGGQGGPTISIITKGGERKFHGSAQDTFRNRIFNANSPDDKKIYPIIQRPLYQLDLFGATFSGPFEIPHLIRPKADLFFFVGFEYQHQLTPSNTPTYDTLPTAAERIGDFSNSVSNTGAKIYVYDPTVPAYSTAPGANNNNVCGYAGAPVTPGTASPPVAVAGAQAIISGDGTSATCNIIPPSRINPNLQKVLNLLPLPNYVQGTGCTGGVSPCGQNYQYLNSTTNNRQSYTASLDWQPEHRPITVGLRFLTGPYLNESQSGGILSSDTVPLGEYAEKGKNYSVSLQVGNTFTPTLVNSFVVGFNYRIVTVGAVDPTTLTVAATGIEVPALYPGAPTFGLLPDFTFGGSNISSGPSIAEDYRNPQRGEELVTNFTDNLTKVWKNHLFAAGITLSRDFDNGNVQNNTRGAFGFNVDSSNAYDTGDTFSNALLGSIDSYQQAPVRPQQYLRQNSLEYYVQDQWKVRGNLTVTYGNRFYQDPYPYEKENKLYGFVPSFYSQAAAPVLYRPAYCVPPVVTFQNGTTQSCTASTVVAVDPLNSNNIQPSNFAGFFVPNSGSLLNGVVRAGSNGVSPSIYSVRSLLFSPRVGFAYSPFANNKTVIRGGGGIYYSRASFNSSGIFSAAGPPPDHSTSQLEYLTISQLAADSGLGLASPVTTTLFPVLREKPYTIYNYSLGLLHEFGQTLSAQVSYVGSQRRHIPEAVNINPIPIGARFLAANRDIRSSTSSTFKPLPDTFFNRYPGYGSLSQTFNEGTGNYNALQVSLHENYRRQRLTMTENFTYSKSLGTNGESAYNPAPYGFYGPDAGGGQRPLIANFNFVYFLPGPGAALHSHLMAIVTDGWELSGDVQAGTAGYESAGYVINSVLDPSGDNVSSLSVSGSTDGARLEVVNPHAPRTQGKYAAPELGTFGNASVNTERGVFFVTDGIAASRNFTWRERYRFNGRAEAYNLTNSSIATSNNPTLYFSTPGSLTNLNPTAFTTNQITSNHQRGRVLEFQIRMNF